MILQHPFLPQELVFPGALRDSEFIACGFTTHARAQGADEHWGHKGRSLTQIIC